VVDWGRMAIGTHSLLIGILLAATAKRVASDARVPVPPALGPGTWGRVAHAGRSPNR
jgi:hypothetical protein